MIAISTNTHLTNYIFINPFHRCKCSPLHIVLDEFRLCGKELEGLSEDSEDDAPYFDSCDEEYVPVDPPYNGTFINDQDNGKVMFIYVCQQAISPFTVILTTKYACTSPIVKYT